jgi:hypothetical protein
MNALPSIRIEGGLLGPDVIEQLLNGDLPGQKPADFGIDGRRNLTDEIAAIFADSRKLWEMFQNRLQRLPEVDVATSITRDAWAIPFFRLLGIEARYNPRAHEVDGLSFAISISHRMGEPDDSPPLHIVGARQELGRVPASGRPRLAPHSLVQEYLNRTEHVWGIVTNGSMLRLLRDCTFIRRQAYVEFDLQGIIEEQRFNDFAVLYRLIHRSRFPRGLADADHCLLEQYYQWSAEQGGRVRVRLRNGVEECIKRLANGFLQHRNNSELRRRLKSGSKDNDRIEPQAFYQQLLRLVYRFLFLLVSEDRGLISSDPLYREHYGVARLRRMLDHRAFFNDYDDIWHSLRVLWKVLSNEELAPFLGVTPLNGELFTELDLDACFITNRNFLEAVRHLIYYQENGVPRRVNYAALDVEELGSVYESLLDYHPRVDDSGTVPVFNLDSGTERKSTGSYYTPAELVAELIRSALDPVIEERLKAARTPEEKQRAILSIRICDPACGSGHFLLAAARRLGKELARIRTGEAEPAPERMREAVRDVAAHCIYGVDKNPLAVELCRVALWIEAHCEGKPLTFLDHRIRCGDSLVGVMDLTILERGIPDGAFTAEHCEEQPLPGTAFRGGSKLSGEEKQTATILKKQNQRERRDLESGQLFLQFHPADVLPALGEEARKLETVADDSLVAIRRKEEYYNRLCRNPERRRLAEACNLWTGAFFQRFTHESEGTTANITTQVLLDHLAERARPQASAAANALAAEHRFFHWQLEFPEVFAQRGFDVVLCNPPWERIKLQEEEFFAIRDPEIARAPNAAARKRLIAALKEKNPELWQEYLQALHSAEATSLFLRNGGRYPFTGRGDINTYSVFAELAAALTSPRGRVGVVLPTGIATDATNQHFFRHLVETGRLVSLFDFENRKKLFPAVDSRMKFCLQTLRGRSERQDAGGRELAEFAFFCQEAADLKDPVRRFTISPEDFRLLNPNTGTAPIFRSRRDAELTKHIYRRVPVLVEAGKGKAGNPWSVEFLAMFHMANDSHLFRKRKELESEGYRLEGNAFVKHDRRCLPLYEAKMIHQFNHRFGDYRDHPERSASTQLPKVPLERLTDPSYQILPHYWVPAEKVEARLAAKGWDRGWLIGWRKITRVSDERTVIAAVIPRVGVGDSMPIFFMQVTSRFGCFYAILASLIFDFAARQKIGGISLSYHYIEQLPVLAPSVFEQSCPWSPGETLADWLRPRVLELTYTAWDLKPFAEDLGYDCPPFPYDPERRFQLRCELDAAFFILYLGTSVEWEREAAPELKALFHAPRDAVAYILDQFPIVRRKDEKHYGVYRTKETILAKYDAMNSRSGKA